MFWLVWWLAPAWYPAITECQMNNEQLNVQQGGQSEESIDFRLIFFKLKKYWYFFLITISVSLLVAYLFNTYALPVYEVSTTVLIEDADGSISSKRLIGLDLSGGQQNLENEMAILHSYKLASRAIRNLDFEVSYFKEQNLITTEIYKEDYPFIVEFSSSHPQVTGIPFNIRVLSAKEYRCEFDASEFNTFHFEKDESSKIVEERITLDRTYRFGEWVESDYYRFRLVQPGIARLDEIKSAGYYFWFNDLHALTSRYRQFMIEPVNREASILQLSMRGQNINKAVDFLNQLTEEYLKRGLENKNRVALQTVDFIDSQIADIQDTLRKTTVMLEEFRAEKQLLNVDKQSEQVFEQIGGLQQSRAAWRVKRKLFGYLKDYIAQDFGDSLDDFISPTSMGIDDPVFVDLVRRLNQLQGEKAALSYKTKRDNFLIKQVDQQIAHNKKVLVENLKNIIRTSEISLNNINYQMDSLFNRLSRLPKAQSELYNLEKNFLLLDNIYTFLLKKRSDVLITKASNTPDNEVIDKARKESVEKIFPKNILNYIIALLIALLLPVGYVLGRDYFDDKVKNAEEFKEYFTGASVVGEIIHNNKDNNLVVHKLPKSAIAESFRTLRTNMEFVVKSSQKSVIMVTSHFPGEGKTFFSENLALSYASYGKKTILLGFDMRKPKIYDDFNLNNLCGLSTVLTNKDNFEQAVQHTEIQNFDVLMAGPVPPNPAEIIASDETADLFGHLRREYDYIIIDTPPVGLVTDAVLLMKHVDASIFVARQGYSNRKTFSRTVNQVTDQGVKNVCVAVNDCNMEVDGYNSKYGYGYYTDDDEVDKRKFWKKLMDK